MEKIIHIGGDEAEAKQLASFLAGRYRLIGCADEELAREATRREPPAAVLVDLDSGGQPRLPIVSRLARAGNRVIALSGDAGTRSVVRAVRSGASDFLGKPICAEELRRSIASLARAAAPPDAPGPFTGGSPAIKRVSEQLMLYAGSDFPVLVLGESGTGKEVAARAIHRLSDRGESAFVARNCAALPELLAESELFGTERGAFTDAVARPGAFELARGGVLFLDEITDTGPAIQAKLLRVLETREYWRLGGCRPVAADVRLVSAALADPHGSRTFRKDLLYRINTLVLELPPLRDRREDIPDLATVFALGASGGRTVPGSAALDKLADHAWPGNVRQLRNVVHRALVLSAGAEELAPEHIVF